MLINQTLIIGIWPVFVFFPWKKISKDRNKHYFTKKKQFFKWRVHNLHDVCPLFKTICPKCERNRVSVTRPFIFYIWFRILSFVGLFLFVIRLTIINAQKNKLFILLFFWPLSGFDKIESGCWPVSAKQLIVECLPTFYFHGLLFWFVANLNAAIYVGKSIG